MRIIRHKLYAISLKLKFEYLVGRSDLLLLPQFPYFIVYCVSSNINFDRFYLVIFLFHIHEINLPPA